jgi:hypothetical protein
MAVADDASQKVSFIETIPIKKSFFMIFLPAYIGFQPHRIGLDRPAAPDRFDTHTPRGKR